MYTVIAELDAALNKTIAFWTLLILALAGGWIANVVKLIGMDFGTITGLLVVRAFGVFLVPLGGVMGYL